MIFTSATVMENYSDTPEPWALYRNLRLCVMEMNGDCIVVYCPLQRVLNDVMMTRSVNLLRPSGACVTSVCVCVFVFGMQRAAQQ